MFLRKLTKYIKSHRRCEMPYKDNRGFIEALEKTGDVVRVKKEVDWDLEVGAIVRRLNEMQGPAVLFEKIKDYPEGLKIFGSPLATFRRLAVAFGLKPDVPISEIFEVYRKRYAKPIKPKIVKDAPCQENIVQGDKVDLFEFPAPMVHDGDGGRYISTWHFIVVKDPDSDWTNWGMYRQMIYNSKTIVGLCLPYSDQGRIFYGKYVPQNKPMPFATVIGPDPLSALVSMAPLGIGVSEVDYAGGLMEEPVELVKCITCDLYVPAHAEIIIEGEILPNVTLEEGPFGEYTGYRSSPRMPRTVYRVKAITYRNNPILTMSNMGVPVDDCALGMSLVWSEEVRKLLVEHGIPVTGVFYPPEGVVSVCVIGVKAIYSNIAIQIANLIFGSKFAAPWTNQVIVVDEDVDPYNLKEVFHAWATRCHPVRGVFTYPKMISAPLIPFNSFEDRLWNRGAKVVFDCTWPLDWDKKVEVPFKSSFNTIYPKEVQEKVLRNWEEYGFKQT
jgi:phenylphosphate carboxylase alpha subunit